MKYEKALEAAQKLMVSGETQLSVTKTSLFAAQNRHPGAAILTDQRLLFAGRAMIALQTRAIALDAITSVDSGSIGVYRTTIIAMAGMSHSFWRLPDDFLNHLAAVLASMRNQRLQPQLSPHSDSATRLHDLERLAKLHESGVLSAAEFAVEKSRLLA